MQFTATVKLKTTFKQHTTLLQTLLTCNAPCDRISQIAFQNQTFRQFDLHTLTYYNTRAAFGLPAQHVVRAIAKVADAYKCDTHTLRTFQATGAIELDHHLLRWKVDEQIATITTPEGRLSISFLCSIEQKQLLLGKRGQSDGIRPTEGTRHRNPHGHSRERKPFESSHENRTQQLGISTTQTVPLLQIEAGRRHSD